MDCERMDGARKLVRKAGIDHAMALDPGLSAEGLRHDIDPEVGFPAWPVTRMALVLMRLVEDAQALGREGCR
jgi:hypothetical protein